MNWTAKDQRRARKYTSALIDLMEDGIMPAETVARMCLDYMSEADVENMMSENDLLEDYTEE